MKKGVESITITLKYSKVFKFYTHNMLITMANDRLMLLDSIEKGCEKDKGEIY